MSVNPEGPQPPPSDGDPDDQKRFKECVLYAFSNVLQDMIYLKYDLHIPRESFHTILEAESVRRGSKIYEVHQQGTFVPNACQAFNWGQKTKGGCKVKDKEVGKSYRITVEAKEITYQQLLYVLELGAGLRVAVCSIKTDKEGHSWHAVAATGLDIEDRCKVTAANSWGNSRRFMIFGEDGCRRVTLIVPTVHEIRDANGVAQPVPEDQWRWMRFLVHASCQAEVILRAPGANTEKGVFEVVGGGIYEGPAESGFPQTDMDDEDAVGGRFFRKNGISLRGSFDKGVFVTGEVRDLEVSERTCGEVCVPAHTYTGQFVEGEADGFGTGVFVAKDILYFPGAFPGARTRRCPSPTYIGQWSGGMRNGNGTFSQWQKNAMGVLEEVFYTGEWSGDVYEGQGSLTYGNGDKFVGQFDGGKPVEGIYLHKDGRKEERKYEYDEGGKVVSLSVTTLTPAPQSKPPPPRPGAAGEADGGAARARSRSPRRDGSADA